MTAQLSQVRSRNDSQLQSQYSASLYTATDSEGEATSQTTASSNTHTFQGIPPPTALTQPRLRPTTSRLSLSLARTLSSTLARTYTDIRAAVADENAQTAASEGHGGSGEPDLNQLLESRFDVGDALRMRSDDTTGEAHSEETPLEAHSEEKGGDSLSLTSEGSRAASANGNAPAVPHGATLEKVFTNKSTGVVELPPDTGYAWIVVLSVFLIMFNTWGCNSAFGVFLSFFLSHNRFPSASKYDYALIAGLTVFLGQGLCPFVIIVMRVIGLKQTMFLGTCIMAAAFVLASYATKLWHLYVTQGFMIGCSISIIFAPATTLLPGWFLKRRAVAMGLSLLGTGAGGVTFGLASNKMIQDNGNTQWCFRMLAITCSIATAIAICLTKERHPIKPVGIRSWRLIRGEVGKMFSWKVIKQPFVPLIALWFTLALFGYNLMIFTLSSYAVARGMSQHQGSSLTAILNGAQCVGRPVMGLLGDRFGRANVTITLTSVLCVLMFGFWIPAHTYLQLIFFAIMTGSCVGVANVMNTVLIADMVRPDEFLPAWSFVNYSGAPALLVTEVVAQALTDKHNKHNPYKHTQIFAGCCFLAALLMILVLREYAVRLKLTRRQEENEKRMSPESSACTSLHSAEGAGAGHRDDDDWETLNMRRSKYEVLLGGGVKKYFLRMAYPMKV